ncbi:MAG: GDSL-type esterase/lipase family protein [bacterium]
MRVGMTFVCLVLWIETVASAQMAGEAEIQGATTLKPAESVHDPSEWEPDIQEFEKLDAIQPPPKNAILFVGSSSIRLWDLEQSFPDLAVINRGFGGSHIEDCIHYAESIILPYKPKIIVLYAGDNDIDFGKSPKRVFSDFKAFVKIVHAALPKSRIVYIAIKPSISRWNLAGDMRKANRRIRE